MNTNNVSGDSKVVVGTPIPDEKGINIPPEKAGEKVIEEGPVVLELQSNTPELVNEVNAKYNKREEDKEHE